MLSEHSDFADPSKRSGEYKTNFCVPEVPLFTLTDKVELTIQTHKIIECIVASAYAQINFHQDAGTTHLPPDY